MDESAATVFENVIRIIAGMANAFSNTAHLANWLKYKQISWVLVVSVGNPPEKGNSLRLDLKKLKICISKLAGLYNIIVGKFVSKW